jgi:diguanylate cyclase (GGDEF)-like protein
MTLNEIVKETLVYLKANALSVTPENYQMAFCKTAKEFGFVVEDCTKLDTFISRLDKNYQNELKKYNVKTEDEFVTFLIAQINRLNPKTASSQVNILITLLKRVLQAVTMLHVKEAADIASITLDKVNHIQKVEDIEITKSKWVDFITTYDDSYLTRLKKYAAVDNKDLVKSSEAILEALRTQASSDTVPIYEELSQLIVQALTPSILSSVDDQTSLLIKNIKESPDILSSPAMQEDIKASVSRRIEMDKGSAIKQLQALDALFEEMSDRLLEFIESGSISSDKVRTIKSEIDQIDFTQESFSNVQSKLMTIASKFEEETNTLTDQMRSNQQTIDSLQQQVITLESKLDKMRKESNEDFLTGLLTRRTLDQELKRAEEAFMRYNNDYAICFIDIDRFKHVNDNFGHEAGDVIISTIGKILKSYAREVDICGRYGGEEFMIILPNIKLQGGIKFANKIRTIVERYKFIYKGTDIPITISCGVSERSDYGSDKETVKEADDMLYKAKNTGRNRVCPQDD